jgi:hypothetical protein
MGTIDRRRNSATQALLVRRICLPVNCQRRKQAIQAQRDPRAFASHDRNPYPLQYDAMYRETERQSHEAVIASGVQPASNAVP